MSWANGFLQKRVHQAIENAEKAVRMVNDLSLFSTNEQLEEVATNEIKWGSAIIKWKIDYTFFSDAKIQVEHCLTRFTSAIYNIYESFREWVKVLLKKYTMCVNSGSDRNIIINVCLLNSRIYIFYGIHMLSRVRNLSVGQMWTNLVTIQTGNLVLYN